MLKLILSKWYSIIIYYLKQSYQSGLYDIRDHSWGDSKGEVLEEMWESKVQLISNHIYGHWDALIGWVYNNNKH